MRDLHSAIGCDSVVTEKCRLHENEVVLIKILFIFNTNFFSLGAHEQRKISGFPSPSPLSDVGYVLAITDHCLFD